MQFQLAKAEFPYVAEPMRQIVQPPYQLLLNILNALMLILPFVYTVISESALPMLSILVYPMTVFIALQWRNQNNSKAITCALRIISVVTIFGIYQLIDFIAISDPILSTIRFLPLMSIAFVGIACFSQKVSSFSGKIQSAR